MRPAPLARTAASQQWVERQVAERGSRAPRRSPAPRAQPGVRLCSRAVSGVSTRKPAFLRAGSRAVSAAGWRAGVAVAWRAIAFDDAHGFQRRLAGSAAMSSSDQDAVCGICNLQGVGSTVAGKRRGRPAALHRAGGRQARRDAGNTHLRCMKITRSWPTTRGTAAATLRAQNLPAQSARDAGPGARVGLQDVKNKSFIAGIPTDLRDHRTAGRRLPLAARWRCGVAAVTVPAQAEGIALRVDVRRQPPSVVAHKRRA